MADSQPVRTELELRDYVGVLRRRKFIIIVVTLVVVGLAVGITMLRPKIYEGEATLVIETPIEKKITQPNAPTEVTDADVQTEAELMQSRRIVRQINNELGYAPKVHIQTIEGTPAVFVSSRNTSAAQAAKEANDFVNTYVKIRQDTIAKTYLNAIDDVGKQMDNLDKEVANDKNRVQEINYQLATGTVDPETAGVLRAEAARLRTLTSPATVLKRQQDLQQKLDTLNTNLALSRRGENYTVSGSAVPTVPVEPRPVRTGFIAFGLGLLLALVVAFMRDYFDDTLRTKEDLDAASGGVPVLALIPAVPGWRDRSQTVLESVSHPHSAASEAYRTLRTSLAFAAINRRIGIIHLTSSSSGEGKTTTAANLAVTLANTGKRVVLVDCDLRRPRVHQFFGLDNKVGFASVLLGEIEAADALQPVPGVKGLSILPSGPPPPNPAELLSTRAARQILDAMAEVGDYVVVDSPPLLPVADAVTLAGYADATILLVAAKATTRRSLHRSLEMLEQIDAPLEGILFNGVGREATYGYGYGYTYTEYKPVEGKPKGPSNPMPEGDQGDLGFA